MSHKTLRTVYAGVLIAVLMTSCVAKAPPTPTSTPTIDPATPAAATAVVKTAEAEAAAATASAEAAAKSTADAQATLDAQATADARATADAIAQMTATQDAKNATATADMAARQTKTAQAVAQKTAQAQPMYDFVQKLVAGGYLESAEGTFTLMPDFSEALAMRNYIAPYPAGISPKWFIIRTNMAWEAQVVGSNWRNTACGFIFHFGKDGSYYYTFLNLRGQVEIGRHKPNFTYIESMAHGFYGTVDIPNGSANFVLVVTPNQITVFVNDKKVTSYQSDLQYTSGELAYSITSGSNKDFGTRCTLTNVELWELE